MPRSSRNNSAASTANIGFEAKLWLAADKLRSNMDAAEYKHVVLGLIFLKYKYKNVAAELLAKLLGDEIKLRSKRNLVQSREFSAVTDAQQRPGFPMLKKTLNAYHNRAIAPGAQAILPQMMLLKLDRFKRSSVL